jgi:exodeoxyribonuclease-5
MTAPTLTPGQQTAYDALTAFLMGKTEHTLAVLEGHAGTGKTFLVSRLLSALTQLDMDYHIAIAAPTNKAVRVLKDKLLEAGATIAAFGETESRIRRRRPEPGCTCRSIHAFLGLKLKEQENGQQDATPDGESTLRDYDIVVIDECSMLDEGLFKKITLERGQARILFVGDPAQLPPVKNKGVALSPAFDRVDYKLRLSEVVRQAKDNPIIRLSIALRQMIERNYRAEAVTLIEALPPVADGPKAALVSGDRQTLIDYWLYQQIECPDSDVRIIAYTNDRVQYYNQAIHQALYNDQNPALLFVPGERVIVHTQCEALKIIDARPPLRQYGVLITSEELTVEAVSADPHPLYPHIAANTVYLRDDFGGHWLVYIVLDALAHAAEVNAHFDIWRQRKTQAEATGNPRERDQLKEQAKNASGKGWALKKAFAPLRHAYAITAHKSQGSTFDCALVDFSDLAKMPDAFSFNRALYVAATRSREFLAIVVT